MCRRQYKTYADGVFTATSPTGPWSYAEYSPASHKPTGFLGGVGHSSTYANHRLHSDPCCLLLGGHVMCLHVVDEARTPLYPTCL